jgi:hypothetical protein
MSIMHDGAQSTEQHEESDHVEPTPADDSESGGQVSVGVGGLGGGQSSVSRADQGRGHGNEGGKVGKSQEDQGGGSQGSESGGFGGQGGGNQPGGQADDPDK